MGKEWTLPELFAETSCILSGLCATLRRTMQPNGTRQPHLLLRELRLQAGLSPNDLAYRTGLSGKTIRMAEAGFIPTPRVQFAIAAAFDRKPLDLWPLRRGAQHPAALDHLVAA